MNPSIILSNIFLPKLNFGVCRTSVVTGTLMSVGGNDFSRDNSGIELSTLESSPIESANFLTPLKIAFAPAFANPTPVLPDKKYPSLL